MGKTEIQLGKNAGLIWLLMSAIFFSLNGLIIKFIPQIKSSQIVFWRGIIQLILYTPILKSYQIDVYDIKNQYIQKLIFWRGFNGTVELLLFFYSVTLIPLSEAQTLLLTSPVWTGILTYFILNEKYQFHEFSCAIVGLIGITLIAKPSFLFGQNDLYQQYQFGRIMALCGSLCQASVFVIIRMIKGRTSIFLINFYYSLINVLLSPIGMIFQGVKNPSIYEFFLLSIIGIISLCAQLLLTRAMTLEKPGKSSVLNYIQVVLSLFYSHFILNENIDFYSFLGSTFIFSTAIIIFMKN